MTYNVNLYKIKCYNKTLTLNKSHFVKVLLLDKEIHHTVSLCSHLQQTSIFFKKEHGCSFY